MERKQAGACFGAAVPCAGAPCPRGAIYLCLLINGVKKMVGVEEGGGGRLAQASTNAALYQSKRKIINNINSARVLSGNNLVISDATLINLCVA